MIITDYFKKILHPFSTRLRRIEDGLEKQMVLQGRILTNETLRRGSLPALRAAEFSVFSQWGEDGIIQYLISQISIENPVFVEFGVENYTESNTRFLMLKDNWKGLVIDGSEEHIRFIRRQNCSWRHHLDSLRAFITKENIDELILSAGYNGEIGLLSIDIDGNDYWVWEAISGVSPCIVIAEYNGLWGPGAEVTVPYDEAFVRSEKHFSNVYYGASLSALISLGQSKGYSFVGSNSTGSNAFFVRKDKLGSLGCRTASEEHVIRKFRESRDADGRLNFLGIRQQLQVIGHLPLHDVRSGKVVAISSLLEELAAE